MCSRFFFPPAVLCKRTSHGCYIQHRLDRVVLFRHLQLSLTFTFKIHLTNSDRLKWHLWIIAGKKERARERPHDGDAVPLTCQWYELAVAFLRTPSHVRGLGFPKFFFFQLAFHSFHSLPPQENPRNFSPHLCWNNGSLSLFWVASSRFPREAPPVSTQSRADAEAAWHCFLSCSLFALKSHLQN